MVIKAKERTTEQPLYCQCCNQNVLAVLKGDNIVITNRGHHLVVPLVDKPKA